jgi:hypothetical protein
MIDYNRFISEIVRSTSGIRMIAINNILNDLRESGNLLLLVEQSCK